MEWTEIRIGIKSFSCVKSTRKTNKFVKLKIIMFTPSQQVNKALYLTIKLKHNKSTRLTNYYPDTDEW